MQADEVTKNLLGQNGLNGDLQADGLAAEPDWGEDDKGKEKVSVIEQCLAFGGERRLRLQVTVSVGGAISHMLCPCKNPNTPKSHHPLVFNCVLCLGCI